MGKDILKRDKRGRVVMPGEDLTGIILIKAELKRADFQKANLTNADIQGADLSCANLAEAELICADLTNAKLQKADLWGADLTDTALQGADLRGATLSAFPISGDSRGVIVDRRIAAQIAAHFCALVCDDPEVIASQEALLPLARTSHRAADLGLLEKEESCVP